MNAQVELSTSTTELTQRGRRRNIVAPAVAALALADTAPDYAESLANFGATLTRQKAQALVDAGVTGKVVQVRIEPTRRKYDRVWLAVSSEVNGKPRWAVAYFVERANGNIYGPKSPVAINDTRWFGTLADVEHFDWSGEFPVCMTDAFVEVRRYGNCAHYKRADTLPVLAAEDFPDAIAVAE